MKVLMCGSRTWDDLEAIVRWLGNLRGEHGEALVVISGGAPRGADRICASVCDALGISLVEVPAEWERYGKRAGILRNVKMLNLEPQLVIAFWDGRSAGTRHTIDEATRRGIPVRIVSHELRGQAPGTGRRPRPGVAER